MEKKKFVPISVRLERSLAEEVRRQAAVDCRTVSGEIRQIIRAALREKGRFPDVFTDI